LHICCAPDAATPWPELSGEGFYVEGFFYGCNIHPKSEWLLRRGAAVRLSEILDGRVEFPEYEPSRWFESVSRFKDSPEGGGRCRVCFGLQLTAAAEFAYARGFKYLCTTLTISPHKDPDAINAIGFGVCEQFGLEWISRVWRKKNGFKLSAAKSREWGLYRQDYCGCEYSLLNRRDVV
jgi:predicted adenine nucleotide alpha hydrolase (AANH) superfamily ATPase